MEKAYDIKALGKRLQDAGLLSKDAALELVEQAALTVYVEVKGWLKESATLSTEGLIGKADDFIAPHLDQLDPLVLPQIDKINPKG